MKFGRLAMPVVLVLLTLNVYAASTQRETYSNVRYSEEAGDLYGVKIEMTITRSRVVAILEDCQGGRGPLIRLQGTRVGSKVNLSGKTDDGMKVEVQATISHDLLQGFLTYFPDGTPVRNRISLPRARRRSKT